MNLNFYNPNALTSYGAGLMGSIQTPLGFNAPKSIRKQHLYGLSGYQDDEDFCIHDAHNLSSGSSNGSGSGD